ncbi:tRNA (adenosine(37)-N6)-dimethylallyltransferase MiaA [Candidatus Shapirobacteria bacterium CG10_big_fil_rev_8_21_14_0_10_40_9]|uniref:tRNA dimethylallyltransferase n=1 Tax=Candidatus Shapirobacteria bacterium CG10_big_fil_rev_8_21_14_0_10_40_9 TaxID=1974888 RepID=A0A2M8L4G7_9BACT|nr:MAG: tRNA (adenosine(37)-N6)-dimethylallyltransferase MiaA [Candidatus Shapirobacteria bacterium CG10_big_fil_rev_8_21_14_0_10_40_9]
MENRLLVICGPTATGKTSLAIKMAKKFNGEIISADSRQVYKGMDIATGKELPISSKLQVPSSKFREPNLGYYLFDGIPVWMLDVVTPAQEFSVAQYVNLAWKVISDIWKRKKSRPKVEDPRRKASGLPIIVGGTGFYIKGIIDGIETLGIPPDWKFRRKLQDLSAQKLFEILARIDQEKVASMNVSDRRNPRRLIRAIEVAASNKKLATQKAQKKNREHRENVLFIGLMALYKTLYQRIDKRIDEQVKMGAEKEVKRLLKEGYTWDLPAMSAMGYGVWRSYFENKKSLAEVVQKWKFDEHAYARRQMTWFRKDPRVCWFDITSRRWIPKVELLVRRWYNPNVSE